MIKNQRFIKLIFALISIYSSTVTAEYRLYQYWVKSNDRENATLVTSSLDPKSYLAYYGSNLTMTLNLVRSWKCPGYTGNEQNFCSFKEPENFNSTPPTTGSSQ